VEQPVADLVADPGQGEDVRFAAAVEGDVVADLAAGSHLEPPREGDLEELIAEAAEQGDHVFVGHGCQDAGILGPA
jgi:hypothetical protein